MKTKHKVEIGVTIKKKTWETRDEDEKKTSGGNEG